MLQSLIKKSGDVTPLIHAMRIEHTDMAIVLLGAFSRYINHLQDEDLRKPETKNLLKMLRAYVFRAQQGRVGLTMFCQG